MTPLPSSAFSLSLFSNLHFSGKSDILCLISSNFSSKSFFSFSINPIENSCKLPNFLQINLMRSLIVRSFDYMMGNKLFLRCQGIFKAALALLNFDYFRLGVARRADLPFVSFHD